MEAKKPLPFGDTSKIISITGESSTILRVLEGWGDRICTLILTVGNEGLVLPIGVVFKGTGIRLKHEKEHSSKLKNVQSLQDNFKPHFAAYLLFPFSISF